MTVETALMLVHHMGSLSVMSVFVECESQSFRSTLGV